MHARVGWHEATSKPANDGDERHDAGAASDQEKWHAGARFCNAIEQSGWRRHGTDDAHVQALIAALLLH